MTEDFFALKSTNQSGASWAVAPDATIDIDYGIVAGLMLYNKHATAIVEYSFDGTNLHGELDPADGTRGKSFDWRHARKVWLRIKTGSTGPAVVSIESWARSS